MEIEIEAYRRLNRLIKNLPDIIVLDRLSNLGITEESLNQNVVDVIMENYDNDLTVGEYKDIWGAAELANFFSSWVKAYKVEPQDITLRSARQKIKHDQYLNNYNMIGLEMNDDPQILFLARTPTSYRSLMDKTLTSEDIRDSVYWFPELGIILTKIHDDENGQIFESIIKEQLVGEMEHFRVISMNVSKLFKNERYINKLVVSADSQITGFAGMDNITFKGEDVKKGLGGLYRRQDIRVNLHEIGPNLAVENQNIHLKVGPHIKIKNIDGIYELHMLIYPELYPDDDNIEEIKQKLSTQTEIPISTLCDDWGFSKFNVKFQLEKKIENGKLRAKLDDELIVKT